MKKSKELKFRAIRFIFSNFLENSLFTIFLTAFIGFAIGAYFKDVFWVLREYALQIIICLIILIFLYYVLSHEKQILKVDFKSGNLGQEWKNNEIRPHIPSTASISMNDKALYLQFMDIPFTLNASLPKCYALEFKAKVINVCLGWCVNAKIDGTNMNTYLFQYFPNEKKLSPCLLMGYDNTKLITLWVVPDLENSPLKSISNLSLRSKNGWYFIRTEVYQYETDIKMPDLNSSEIKKIVPSYKDAQGNEVIFDRTNRNKVVEIKIYDMNDLGKIVYHIFFDEPPFKCFWEGKIGFRNHGFESSLYKDIVLKKIG